MRFRSIFGETIVCPALIHALYRIKELRRKVMAQRALGSDTRTQISS